SWETIKFLHILKVDIEEAWEGEFVPYLQQSEWKVVDGFYNYVNVGKAV
ncbi:6688_t:CDS:1, partial [Dentiscutata erythropus]